MRKILLSIASLLIFAGSINATNIGYSKDDIDRLNTFRLGSSQKHKRSGRSGIAGWGSGHVLHGV